MQRITYMLNYNIARSGNDSLKELRAKHAYLHQGYPKRYNKKKAENKVKI